MSSIRFTDLEAMYDHPNVLLLADKVLETPRALRRYMPSCVEKEISSEVVHDIAFVALLRMHCYVQEHGKKHEGLMFLKGVSLETLDQVTGIKGFAHAMTECGLARFVANSGGRTCFVIRDISPPLASVSRIR